MSHPCLQALPGMGAKLKCFVKESLDKMRKTISPCGSPVLLPVLRSPRSQQEVFITDPERVVLEMELLNPSHLLCQGRKA